ncbi:MAG: PAS domain S-box protein [Desulfobacteraceae bacterium]|nr:PAS domain S-box protein [Desulfobacteraceae bacterium]
MVRKPTYEELEKRIKELETEALEIKRAKEALRESEERFRNVADFTYDWEYWIGPDGHYIYISPSCERITGYSPEWFVNDPGLFEKIVHPDDHSVVVSHIREEQKQEEVFSIDFRIITRSGEELWISHNCQPVYGTDGNYLGRRASNRDISKRKKMQEELLKAKKLESLGVLAGGIAHDFNNMLAAVLGKISIAQMETKPGTKAFELLTEAENAGMRAKGLTAKLITFSKGGDPFKQEVSIGEFVKDSVSSALSGSDIDSEFTIPDDLWPVNIDEVQMKHVIHNIVTNAVEAISGQGTIKVSCENVEIGEKDGLTLKAGKYVKISLKDQGYGIPEENLSKIFDPYYSTKEMGTDKGMGLGLSISHSIVKKHGGLITVESELGVGTTFFICLPESDLGLRNAGLGLERKLRTKKKPIIGKRKILVMDDEEMVRDVTAAMLSKIGYEVELAKEGSEAIEMYIKDKESDQSYDGVILDLTNKIGMGGKEAIKKLLEIDPDVKAIVSTGYSYDPIVTKFREYGFCGALTKPFSMDELGKTVRKVLEGN